MNIEQDIKVMQGELDGRKVEVKGKRGGQWRVKDGVSFNFQEYDYRLAPYVVYKIDMAGETSYDVFIGDRMGSTYTKGYWVEGEL